jgi:hypothetical protein
MNPRYGAIFPKEQPRPGCWPPEGTKHGTMHVLVGHGSTTETFTWDEDAWFSPGTHWSTDPVRMGVLGWRYQSPAAPKPKQLCPGCATHPGTGHSKLCIICSGWKREVDDLTAVNAHHVEERDYARRERDRLVNRFRATVAWLKARNAETEANYLDAVADNYFRGVQDGREQVLRHRGMKASDGPRHMLSLGPEPSTVAEWVEQTERTGILEFPLLLEIAGAYDPAAMHNACGLLSELCAAVETHPIAGTNQIIEDTRAKCRRFLAKVGMP